MISSPDVIHCNDWQTALVPIYYSIFYANNDWYRGIKTVFTIHNIQYQGKYGKELLEDVLGIPQSALPILEYDDCVNMMKGAIETANRVTHREPHLCTGDSRPVVLPQAWTTSCASVPGS